MPYVRTNVLSVKHLYCLRRRTRERYWTRRTDAANRDGLRQHVKSGSPREVGILREGTISPGATGQKGKIGVRLSDVRCIALDLSPNELRIIRIQLLILPQ